MPDIPPQASVKGILVFMAVGLVIDSLTIVLGGALRGSGDTRFVMITNAITSAFFLVLPTFIVVEILDFSVYAAFVVMMINLSIIASVFVIRFQGGKWKTIRVIDEEKK